ncbi:hypothetical protein SDC9_154014 [bioreactor metagenome]|uniref:Uncharacterized protein n=1 Tax=bioreactor metagenome TaxID=1076179 RepID=A0A645EXW8_9ZZZZ
MIDEDTIIPKHVVNHPVPGSTAIGKQSDDLPTKLIFFTTFYWFIPSIDIKVLSTNLKIES